MIPAELEEIDTAFAMIPTVLVRIALALPVIPAAFETMAVVLVEMAAAFVAVEFVNKLAFAVMPACAAAKEESVTAPVSFELFMSEMCVLPTPDVQVVAREGNLIDRHGMRTPPPARSPTRELLLQVFCWVPRGEGLPLLLRSSGLTSCCFNKL